MRLGIVSDTHGHVLNALAAVRVLEEMDVAAVLHCGDIGSVEIPPLFKLWPTHYVFGNCDYHEAELRQAIQAAGDTNVCHERMGTLELGGRQIAFLHSDDRWRFLEVARSNKFDLVCYGHTHVAKQEQVGKTLVLNPGALYRANPHTLAIVDLETMQAEILACV